MFVFLFDIDGTLLDTGGAGKAAFEAVMASQFAVRQIAADVPFAGRTDRAIVRDLFRRHRIDDTPATWRRFVQSYPQQLREALPRYQGHVLPGVRQLVDHLHQRSDVAVGLLTGNMQCGARLKLGHYGLDEYFPFGSFGDHHLSREDVARDALDAAHRHLDHVADRKRVVVVGDTPHDIRCGRAIGALVVAVATGPPTMAILADEKPDLVLQSLSNMAPVLRLITSP